MHLEVSGRSESSVLIVLFFFSRAACLLLLTVTDQAKGFVDKKTSAVHRRLGITHVTTPPYWPQANALVERAVGILKNVLRKIIEPHRDWDKKLPEAVLP